MLFAKVLLPVSLIAAVSAGVVVDRRKAFTLQNGKDAQALNKKFESLTPASPCKNGEQACVKGKLGQCIGGKFVLQACAGGLECIVLPLDNKPGTSITCDSLADAEARIAGTGATGGITGSG